MLKQFGYEIYINDNKKTQFMNYDWIKENHTIKLSDYTKAYEGNIEDEVSEDESIDFVLYLLEDIYFRFNSNPPSGYNDRSLSVSDIVMIDNRCFIVDSFGFKELVGL